MARVLVVDDNRGLRLLFGKQLSHMGHTVLYAENGKDALTIAEAMQPDVIFLDVNMPIMTGDETLTVLKTSEWASKIKVTLMSAANSLEYLRNLHIADMVLCHPISMQELKHTMIDLLPS
jgi:CheY-like chemotaxis protein